MLNALIKDSPLSGFAARSHELLAKMNIESDNLPEAEKHLTIILQNRRNTPAILSRAKMLKAKIELWRGENSNAVTLLSQVSARQSDDEANDAIELSMLLGTAKFDSINVEKFITADKYLNQKKFHSALDLFSELAVQEKSLLVSEASRLKYAELLAALGNYSEACEFLKKVLDNETESIFRDKLTYLLGNVYLFGLKNNANAISAFEKVLENYPNSLYLDECRKKLNELKTLESENL